MSWQKSCDICSRCFMLYELRDGNSSRYRRNQTYFPETVRLISKHNNAVQCYEWVASCLMLTILVLWPEGNPHSIPRGQDRDISERLTRHHRALYYLFGISALTWQLILDRIHLLDHAQHLIAFKFMLQYMGWVLFSMSPFLILCNDVLGRSPPLMMLIDWDNVCSVDTSAG